MATVATTQRPRGGGTKRAPARKKAAPPPTFARSADRRAWRPALGSHAGDVVGLLCIALGIVAGMGVYANAAGPVGRGLDTASAWSSAGAGSSCPSRWSALGIVLVRGIPTTTTPTPDLASQSYLWVGGLMIAIGGCGLLHLTNGRPGLDAPTDELVDAGGLLGVAAAGPLAAGIAPWGAGLILGALVLAGLVVLTRVPVRVAAESTAAATRPAGLALVDAAKRVGGNLFSLGGAPAACARRAALRPGRRRRSSTSTQPATGAAHLRRPPGPAQAEGAAPGARRAGARPSSSRSSSARR